jgi:tetratricopeptide (TPR) repeat protein
LSPESPKANGESPRPEGLPAWALVAVAAAAFLIYANTLSNGFVFDDIPVVVQNPNIRGLSRIPHIFSSGYGEGTQLGFTALYRPIVILTLAANYQAGGLAPWHYHLVNAFIHGVNALLVLLLAFRLTRSQFASVAAAFIFALHPVNTEAVAPVVGRTDLLGTFFVLCSLILYAKYAQSDRSGRSLLAGSLACLAGGLLSKEHAVILPGLVILWDLAARDATVRDFLHAFPGRLLRVYSLFIGVVAAYLFVRLAVVGSLGVGATISVLDNPLMALGQPARFFTAAKVSLMYLSRLLAPTTLVHDYSYPLIRPATFPEAFAALFVLAIFAWALYYSYRKNRCVFYGLAFFAIGFSIVSNLVFLIGTIMAERLLYLPGIGFAIAAGALLEAGREHLAGLKTRALAVAAAVGVLTAVCVLFGIRTALRNRDWHSQRTLYEQAIRVVPNNAKIHTGYAETLSESGELNLALVEFSKALALLDEKEPKYFPYVVADILFDMANIYKKQGLYDDAVRLYEKVLALRSDRPEFLFNYGRALYAARRYEEARGAFDKYIAKDPAYDAAYNELGLTLEELGDYGGAEKAFLKCIELAPGNASACRNLGFLYLLKFPEGEKAIPYFERSLALDPDQPDAAAMSEFVRRYHQNRGGGR